MLRVTSDKTMNYLATVSIFIDFYKEGYLTDEEYKTMEEKLVKKYRINSLSVYMVKLNDLKIKLLR